jgi:hypothetical protein
MPPSNADNGFTLKGGMVQIDESPHDWFGGRGGQAACMLMMVIDDATSRRRARFYMSETPETAMDRLGAGSASMVFAGRHTSTVTRATG